MRIVAMIVVVALALVAVPPKGLALVSSGATEFLTAEAGRVDCIDCRFEGIDPDPPIPGFHYVYYTGEWDCEDGYSPAGPCVTCEGPVGCEVGYLWAEDPDLCNLELCIDEGREVHDATLEALASANMTSLQEMITRRAHFVRLRETEAVIDLYSCQGRLIRSVTVSPWLALGLRESAAAALPAPTGANAVRGSLSRILSFSRLPDRGLGRR